MAAGLFTGCYTDPVNMRPTISILTPATPLYRGQRATYTASAGDPDGDALRIDLLWTTGACPTVADAPAWAQAAGAETTPGSSSSCDQATVCPLELSGDKTKAPFCVWARARDGYGALAITTLGVPPLDHAPTAVLDVAMPSVAAASSGGFPVHTSFMFSAANSTDADGDDLTYAWAVKVGFGDFMPLVCNGASNAKSSCLRADVAGDYDIELTVSDGASSSEAHQLVHVEPGARPMPVITVVAPDSLAPYPFGTTFRLTGEHSVDADSMVSDYVWTLAQRPTGSTAQVGACAAPTSPVLACLTADLAGRYLVELTITSDGGAASVMTELDVLDDQFPWIVSTEPALGGGVVLVDTTMDKLFRVLEVHDDLDPYPDPSGAQPPYQWTVLDAGGNVLQRAVDSAKLDLPAHDARYVPGDQVRVRLEIRDRDASRAQQEFATCTTDTCSATNDLHLQRTTWSVRFY